MIPHYNLLLLLPTIVHAIPLLDRRVGQNCPEDSSHECMAGGVFNTGGAFSGRYMCRETTSWLFFKKNETVCVPSLFGASIGIAGDRCGCCEGVCPQKCECPCNNDDEFHVFVYKDTPQLLGKDSREMECVSQGKASRWTARNQQYNCVPLEDCPTLAPTMSPTLEPTTEFPTFSPTVVEAAMMPPTEGPAPTSMPSDKPSREPTTAFGRNETNGND